MDQRYHRGKLILIVCTFCFCLLTAYSFGRFETNFFEMEMEKSQEELKKSAEVEAKFVQNRYENMIVPWKLWQKICRAFLFHRKRRFSGSCRFWQR